MKLSHVLIFIGFIFYGCVDSFDLKVDRSEPILVVDGMITNEPGPYTVRLFISSNVGDILAFANPSTAAEVKLVDDQGQTETLKEIKKGIYITSENGMQGQVGRSYHIEIKTRGGLLFSSIPEVLKPAGEIDSLYFEFKVQEVIQDGTAVPNNGFNVYLNAKGNGEQSSLRWKWEGQYDILTHPELNVSKNTGGPGPAFLATPIPCSNYVSDDGISIRSVGECQCCYCYIKQKDTFPVLSDGQYSSEENYSRIKLAFIPATGRYFYGKYHFEVQQLSLSENTALFWKFVRSQQGGSNIFQPPISIVKSNIVGDGKNQALGIFSACGVAKKSIWISRDNIPYTISDFTYNESCLALDSTSTTNKPSFWY